MSDETIVAVYDTAEHADAAVHDLIAFGIHESSISRHGGMSATFTETAPREEGFWSRLFGGEPDHDTALYDRSLDSGSSVVTVRATSANADDIMDILDKHAPIDLDERAISYNAGSIGSTGMAMDATTSSAAMGLTSSTESTTGADLAYETVAPVGLHTATGVGSETIQLAEERLSVGKRLVSVGGTRVRRFVVETPVEEQVTLHSETVTLERRPVTDGRPVTASAFTETTIEMMETAEEAVVAKSTVVTEEISLHKEATDRIETVRDTLRREDVEIEQLPAGGVARPVLQSAK